MANYNNQIDVQSRIANERLKNKNYLLKSFEDFRSELLQYAVTYFPDKMNDFSETSVGGMLLDFAAIVGDSLSYYMDHQFNELDPTTATENENILRHIRRTGIKSSPPSPSTIMADFSIKVDIENGQPKKSQLPKLLKNLQISSTSGINFILIEDIDFNDGIYKRKILNNNAGYYILSKEGICVSGNRITESYAFGNTVQQFPTITLGNRNITQIEKIVDSENNEYYEVDYLSQDTIYKSIKNLNSNENYYEILPAPYRFVRDDNLLTGETILRFGSATKQDLQNNILIDPSSAAISLYGREYFSKLSFDPAQLLKTNSLGISPKNTTLFVTYRYGGGLNHNIPVYSLDTINTTSNIIFNENATELDTEFILRNISVQNTLSATGGTDGLTFAQLQENIPNVIKMQNRIINYQDLLARLYSMPAPLGRISKATIVDDEYDFFNKNLYLLCYDQERYLTYASDALKKNVSKYINDYRLIGDSFRLLDGIILNFSINIKIRIKEGNDPETVKNNVIQRILSFSRFDLYQIGQPIILDDLYNIVINTPNVISIASEKKNFINSISGIRIVDAGNTQLNYSNHVFNAQTINYNDVLYPQAGAIFELKYPEYNINIQVVT
jgi:hypothetical protein